MGNTHKSRTSLVLSGFGVVAAGFTAFTLTATPAMAATNICGTTPAQTETVHHDAVTHEVTETTPGQAEVGYDLQRWAKEVLGTQEVTQQQTQVAREVPETAAVTHQESRYSRDIPGTPAVTEQQVQVTREHPGTAAVTHTEDQYSRVEAGTKALTEKQVRVKREVPGTAAVTHTEYQYSRQNPGQAEKSHSEYQFSQTNSVKEYRYALESKTVTYTGSNSKAIKWLNDNSSSHSGNQWTLKTSVLESAHFDWSKVAKDGSVSLSAYGGPSVTVSYHINPESQISDWTTSTTSTIPGGYLVGTRTTTTTVYRTANGGTTTDKSQAGWFTQSSFSGWTQAGSRKVVDQAAVAPYTEYKTDGGVTTDKSKADWFTQSSFSGWTQSNSRVVTDKPATAASTVYRTQDGGTTTDPDKAGWFSCDDLASLKQQGWSQYGDSKVVVVTPATPDTTYYLVVKNGTQSESTNKADASWVNPKKVDVDAKWSTFNHRTVTDTAATDPYTEFRAQDGSATTKATDAGWFPATDLDELQNDGWQQYGNAKDVTVTPATPDTKSYLVIDADGLQTESADEADASWVNPDTNTVNPEWSAYDERTVTDTPAKAGYTEYLDADGNATTNPDDAAWRPLDDLSSLESDGWHAVGDPKTVVITPAVPGYTEYYVPNADPSTTLTDDNWTKDTPEGWDLVDTQHVVVSAAVDPVTTTTTVVDQAAYDEEVVTKPAQDIICPVIPDNDDNGTPDTTTTPKHVKPTAPDTTTHKTIVDKVQQTQTSKHSAEQPATKQATQQQSAATAPVAKQQLAHTGADALPWVGTAGGLMVVGVGAMIVSQQRKRRRTQDDES